MKENLNDTIESLEASIEVCQVNLAQYSEQVKSHMLSQIEKQHTWNRIKRTTSELKDLETQVRRLRRLKSNAIKSVAKRLVIAFVVVSCIVLQSCVATTGKSVPWLAHFTLEGHNAASETIWMDSTYHVGDTVVMHVGTTPMLYVLEKRVY